MAGKISRDVNMSKIAVMTVIINAMQMIASVCLVAATVLAYESLNRLAIQVGMALMAGVVCWGGVMDIREAFLARRISDQADMLEASHRNLEELNLEMRKQRHDFMNHLQVVYSLVELGDENETREYIERVYGDLKRVGQVLKTSVPAMNALIAAKQIDAEERAIQMRTDVRTALEGLNVPGWELCRVLGNLIDNAFDALSGALAPEIRLSLSEDVQFFRLSVWNNGPAIPDKIKEHIFEERFSTKGSDRGMGLSIVRDIVTRHEGTIRLASDEGGTSFEILFRKTGRIDNTEEYSQNDVQTND